MLLPIKAVCKTDRVRRDGASVIYIQYCQDSFKRILLNTGLSVPPKYWHAKRQFILNDLPAVFGKANELNDRLRFLVRRTEDLIRFSLKKEIDNTILILNEFFHSELTLTQIEVLLSERQRKVDFQNPKLNLDFYFQIDDYIKSKSQKVTPGMLRIYRNMKEHLQAFDEYKGTATTFQSFDLDYYEALIDFLSLHYIQRRRKKRIIGLKVNTIGKTIKQLRNFLKNRIRKKIIAPIDLEDFNIVEEEVDTIYLTWEEIKKIYNVDLSKCPHLLDYRNVFVLGCMTGLRFSDFSTIQPNDIRNGMLHKKQNKSDSWVVIPLRKEAISVLSKEFSEKFPVFTNAEFNRHIKKVGKLAGISDLIKLSHKKGTKDIIEVRPKYEWITSHTCRRSFCTNEFLAGTPTELIMKISGHKSIKDFYKYIRISHEEAARKIRDLWERRGEVVT